MGKPEISAFLSSLATNRRVGASTQNQALAAPLFLYQRVLGRDLAWMDQIVRAKRPERLLVSSHAPRSSCCSSKSTAW